MRSTLFSSVIVALLLSLASTGHAQTWVPIGPNTGEVHDLFFSPHNPDAVYASGVLTPENGNDTQLMVSVDGGLNFSYLRNQDEVRGLAFHPSSPDTLWMLENNMYSRSVDGGLTWDDQSIPGTQYLMTDIARSPGDDGALYMLNTQSNRSILIRSLDEGDTWDTPYSVYNLSEEFLHGLFFRPGVSDTLYTIRSTTEWMTEGDAVWRSMDGGENWECMGSVWPGDRHWEMLPILHFHPTDLSLVFSVGEVIQGNFGLISRDGGASFQLLMGPWGGSEWVYPFLMDDGTVVVVTPVNVYASTDGAYTWTPLIDDPESYPVANYSFLAPDDLILNPYNPDSFFIAYQDVFIHSADSGNTWSASVHGFSGSNAISIQTSRASADVVHVQTSGGIFRSEDRGTTWTVIGIGEHVNNMLSQANSDYCVRWEFGHPWMSGNGGQTWIELDELGNTTSFAWHPTNPLIALAIANPSGTPPGVYRTEDGGYSWDFSTSFGDYVGTLHWDPLEPDRVLLLSGNAMMMESLDGGASFHEYNVGEMLVDYQTQPDGTGAIGLGYPALTERGMYTSDRYTPVFERTFSLPNEMQFLDYAPDGWILSHRYDNAWVSPDMGTNWWPIYQSTALAQTAARTLGVTADGTIFVAAGSDGALMSTDALSVEERAFNGAPISEFRLLPVYPNPFNGTAVVSFELPNPQTVTISLVNVLGQEVRVLADQRLFAAGRQKLAFDAGELASGVYFIRAISSADMSTMQRITLVR